MPGMSRLRSDRRLLEQLRRHTGRRALTDEQIAAELDQAWNDLRGSVASEDSLPEMTIRLAVARLRGDHRAPAFQQR